MATNTITYQVHFFKRVEELKNNLLDDISKILESLVDYSYDSLAIIDTDLYAKLIEQAKKQNDFISTLEVAELSEQERKFFLNVR